jgi:hypothetical protein
MEISNYVHSAFGKHHGVWLAGVHCSAGTFPWAFVRSNSQPRASTTSLTLLAHKIVNSNTLALMLVRARRSALSVGSLRQGERHGGVAIDFVYLGFRR